MALVRPSAGEIRLAIGFPPQPRRLDKGGKTQKKRQKGDASMGADSYDELNAWLEPDPALFAELPEPADGDWLRYAAIRSQPL